MIDRAEALSSICLVGRLGCTFEMPISSTSKLRLRCCAIHIGIGKFALSLLLLLSFPLTFANDSSEVIIGNDEVQDDIVENAASRYRMEQYYFRHEVDFLARQAMILGNHPDAVKRTTATTIDGGQEELNRLRFLEKSLQIELDYIRRIREIKADPDKVLANTTASIHETPVNATDQNDVTVEKVQVMSHITEDNDVPAERIRLRHASDIIIKTINDATWPTWSSLPAKEPATQTQTIQMNDSIPPHDSDWHEELGFLGVYDEFGCSEHALDQNKPLYTPEMWRGLREAFRESTLFPFPLPELEEIPNEPIYVNYTTDQKGRGAFASRNITKGEMVHSGHPNTAFFLDASSWFRFVALLPRDMACDVMEWAWQQDLSDTGHVVMCLNLDEAVFFNDGGFDNSLNMEMRDPTSLDFFATQDISVGQELLYDYDHFVFETTEMNL